MGIYALQTATLRARRTTGDRHIATSAEKGRINVVRAVPPATGRGAYAITTLAAGLSIANAVQFLDRMSG